MLVQSFICKFFWLMNTNIFLHYILNHHIFWGCPEQMFNLFNLVHMVLFSEHLSQYWLCSYFFFWFGQNFTMNLFLMVSHGFFSGSAWTVQQPNAALFSSSVLTSCDYPGSWLPPSTLFMENTQVCCRCITVPDFFLGSLSLLANLTTVCENQTWTEAELWHSRNSRSSSSISSTHEWAGASNERFRSGDKFEGILKNKTKNNGVAKV